MQFRSEESRKYLCPFKPENCAGSGCAAWKWVMMEKPDYKRPISPPISFQPSPMIQSDVGYCGLVGQ